MKQFAVVGLGRFGRRVVSELSASGVEVLAVDHDPELVQDMAPIATHAVCLDTTDEQALRAVGLPEMDGVVVAIGRNVESSVLAVSLLSEMGVPVIVARAVNRAHARILAKVGATRVVYPEDDAAVNVAQSLISDYVVDYFSVSEDLTLARVRAPREFLGRTLRDLALRPSYNVSVVAIDRCSGDGGGGSGDGHPAEHVVVNMPGPDAEVQEGDILVILGDADGVSRLRKAIDH